MIEQTFVEGVFTALPTPLLPSKENSGFCSIASVFLPSEGNQIFATLLAICDTDLETGSQRNRTNDVGGRGRERKDSPMKAGLWGDK